MRVREGVGSDATTLAEFAEVPVGVAERLLRDRTVRIAEPAANEADSATSMRGFVAFSARPGTVHITRLDGDVSAVDRLLDEPIRFAKAESMAVEIVLPVDEPVVDVLEDNGFEPVGRGPTFDGGPTRRYRYDGGD